MQSLQLLPRLEVKICQKLVLYYALLQLPATELEAVVEEELGTNPALDCAEGTRCVSCGSLLSGAFCPVCYLQTSRMGSASGLFDPDASPRDFPAPVPLREILRRELAVTAPPRDHATALLILDELDEHGYFREEWSAFLDRHRLSVEEGERALHAVQQLSPTGIGARSLQECLLLQLAALEEEERGNPVARAVVEQAWHELATLQVQRIAKIIGKSKAEVIEALQFIKRNLFPFPGSHLPGPFPGGDGTAGATPTLPDVIISRDRGPGARPSPEVPEGATDRFTVEVVDRFSPSLRVNPLYVDLWSRMRATPNEFTTEEHRHVEEYFLRAKQFMENVRLRRQTLHDIARCLVRLQREFLEHGRGSLKPLTRHQVARILGYHPSTIGRAVAGKTALLPSNEIVLLDLFFQRDCHVKEAILVLLKQEDPHHPLTDQDLAERLAGQGMSVARRTVAKYRGELRILPYNQRPLHHELPTQDSATGEGP